MTPTATPVSAATEQEHQHNDNQEHFHGISPLMATALFAGCPSIQRPVQCIVPDERAIRQFALWGMSNFALFSAALERAMRCPRLERDSTTLPDRAVPSIDA